MANTREHFLFMAYGSLNFLITNASLLMLLTVIPTYAASAISIVINLSLGYILNRYKVFASRPFIKAASTDYLFRYLVVAAGTWLIYTAGIPAIKGYLGISKELSALILIPLLTIYSYVLQSKFVFLHKQKTN